MSVCVQFTIHWLWVHATIGGRKSNRACPHSNPYIKYRTSCNLWLHGVMTFIILHTILPSKRTLLSIPVYKGGFMQKSQNYYKHLPAAVNEKAVMRFIVNCK